MTEIHPDYDRFSIGKEKNKGYNSVAGNARTIASLKGNLFSS